jgi:hypothetical protein
MPLKTRSKNPTVPSVDNMQPKMRGEQKSILEIEHNNNTPNDN